MDPQPLSKSAQKKAARTTRFAEQKLERRAREKEVKKEKKRIRAEKRAAGELDEEDEAEKARQKKKPRLQFGGKIVVDLGFDEMMSEKEVKSLCSQLAYTYSANRAASYPFSLVFTSLNGRTMERLESLNDAGYKRWSNTEWWTDGYDRLWQRTSTSSTADAREEANKVNQGESTTPNPSVCTKENVIYLTADSEEELSELKAEETYIIGGIVDRNRYKNLCQDKAAKSSVRTARLPIGRYLESLPTRKVLTVNQVFEILIKWVETRDWEAALTEVIPKRKFNADGKRTKSKEVNLLGDEDAETVEGENQVEVEDPAKEEEEITEGDIQETEEPQVQTQEFSANEILTTTV